MWNTLTEIKADSVGNTEATNEFDCTGMTWFICLQLSSSSICRYHSPSVYAALSAAWLITPKAAKYLEHFSNAFWQISWNAASLMDWIAFHQELHWRLEPNCEQLWPQYGGGGVTDPWDPWCCVHHHHQVGLWYNNAALYFINLLIFDIVVCTYICRHTIDELWGCWRDAQLTFK